MEMWGAGEPRKGGQREDEGNEWEGGWEQETGLLVRRTSHTSLHGKVQGAVVFPAVGLCY